MFFELQVENVRAVRIPVEASLPRSSPPSEVSSLLQSCPSGGDALQFAQAGAGAMKLYTAFGYQDLRVAREIKDELVELLQK